MGNLFWLSFEVLLGIHVMALLELFECNNRIQRREEIVFMRIFIHRINNVKHALRLSPKRHTSVAHSLEKVLKEGVEGARYCFQ